MEIGPIQLIVVGFEQPRFKGEILRELDALRERGDIRMIDALGVHKSEEGNVTAVQLSDLSMDERMEPVVTHGVAWEN